MLIDIALTCFNCEKYIKECIESIVKQNYTKWKVYFVNDKSSDNSLDVMRYIVKVYGLEDKCYITENDENKGYGFTLNKAISLGSGELVAVIDSDDALATPDAFSIMVDAHKKHKYASLCFSNYMKCNDKLIPIRVEPIRPLKKGESFFDRRSGVSHLKVFKREAYMRTEGVDRKLIKCVDKDLILKLEEVGDLIHVNKVLYLYRNHAQNISTRYNSKEFADSVRERVFDNARKRRSRYINSYSVL